MNFALIGVAGFVAPRHLKAIKDTGHSVTVALDRSDNVGILDQYFPGTAFFTEFERMDRHVERLRRGPDAGRVHYVSVCSPNYLHDAHVRFALRVGADAVCEKPLVLEPWNVDALMDLERESGRRVWCILQLRLHPSIVALRQRVAAESDKMHDIDLTYVTARGSWYHVSWKGSDEKSGGVAMNIGVHFFDMLLWIFGSVKHSTVHLLDGHRGAGLLELDRARVRWFLSVDPEDLPAAAKAAGRRTARSLVIDGETVEFSDGFSDLHTETYRELLAGRGFGPADSRPAIQLVHDIRSASAIRDASQSHPLVAGRSR